MKVTNTDPSHTLIVQTARADNPTHVLTGPRDVAPGETLGIEVAEGEAVIILRGGRVLARGEQQQHENFGKQVAEAAQSQKPAAKSRKR